jgi:monofunctional glycosyltransferase
LSLRQERGRHRRRGVSGWVWRAAFGVLALTVLPVVALRWLPPPASAVMLEQRIGRVVRGEPARPIRYRWTTWSHIAPALRLAVVAAEDQKFPQHWGFDFDAISRAVEEASDGGRVRGASTISQQVARNLFLWQGRSWIRKGLEAYFTALVEACWSKRRILEMYLNIAEFGDGLYGAGAAAQAYFGKRPAELQPREAALLAAVLPNPKQLHVRAPSEYVKERAAWIETQMAHLGPGYLSRL